MLFTVFKLPYFALEENGLRDVLKRSRRRERRLSVGGGYQEADYSHQARQQERVRA